MKYVLSRHTLQRLDRDEWLTDRERKVFTLFYKRGWTIEDIATELEVARSTINRVLRGLRRRYDGEAQ